MLHESNGNYRRAIIVPAVSTPEQASDEKESLDAQERDGLAYCERMGFTVIDIIRIEGFSRSYFTLRELVDAASAKGEQGPARLEEHIKRRDFDVMVVRATNRFNREQSLNAEIIGKTVRLCHAEVHSSLDGVINEQNYRGMIAITGYRDSMEVDELKRRRLLGMKGRIGRGQKLSSGVPFGFMEVDDPKHRKRVMAPDPQYRRLFDDLATLLLEGVSYNALEEQLHARFGHPKYPHMKFRLLIYSAVFWGHNAMHYRSRHHPNGQKSGPWVFDEGEPLPPGVVMERSTHTPIYTGEQAARVKAELRRRTEMIGRRRPHNTAAFAGLLVCWECHYYVVLNQNVRNGRRAWYCTSGLLRDPVRRASCTQRRQIRDDKVQAHFHRVIEAMLAANDLGPFGGQDEAVLADRRAQISAEIDDTTARLRRLMDAVSTVDSSNPAWQLYTDEIRALGELLKGKRAALNDAERQLAEADTTDQRRALEDIRAITLERFWSLPSHQINQLLRRLVGKYRLAMENGELKYVVVAPNSQRNRWPSVSS